MKMKTFGILSGILAFALCMAGGIWILLNSGFDTEDALTTGIGLYFIGKALFVGPMLVLTTLKMCEEKE